MYFSRIKWPVLRKLEWNGRACWELALEEDSWRPHHSVIELADEDEKTPALTVFNKSSSFSE